MDRIFIAKQGAEIWNISKPVDLSSKWPTKFTIVARATTGCVYYCEHFIDSNSVLIHEKQLANLFVSGVLIKTKSIVVGGEDGIEHFMWRHCCHVGGQKQYIFSPLGNKIYFHAKLFHCFSPPTWPPWKDSIADAFHLNLFVSHIISQLLEWLMSCSQALTKRDHKKDNQRKLWAHFYALQSA